MVRAETNTRKKVQSEKPLAASPSHFPIRPLQDQADTFYVSGHGNHSTGQVLGGELSPDAVQPYWGQDIDKVIIAGCSVLDINDYNNFFVGPRPGGGNWASSDHTASPGETWATVGPKLLMGYNAMAPLDDNVGDPNFTKDIITNYLNSTETDDVKRWMYANRDKAIAADPNRKNGLGVSNPNGRPWNACVIDMRGDGAYWYWDVSSPDAQGYPTLKMVPRSEW